MTSDFDIICPKCDAINPPDTATCQNCSHRFTPGPSTVTPTHRPAKQRSAAPPPRLLNLIKPFCILVVLGLLTWGCVKVFLLVSTSFKNLIPYPTDPALTTTEFFSALALEDYQECYELLSIERKTATIISLQTMEAYFEQFGRMRAYLNERSGENFLDTLEVSPDGQVATFNNDIKLSIALKRFAGLHKDSHYSIANLPNFPIDVAPAMGFEERTRIINRIIETGDDPSSFSGDLDPADVTRSFLDKSKTEQLTLLIESFVTQRQLDTRHTLLDLIIMQSPREPIVRRFLTYVANDEGETHQLRRTAQNALSR
ncbi:MAG: hypothetical protein IID32_06805 [Planctomycetes bacterium]|nr:hypothetical protein [Planctomycetota bacterium]